MNYFKYSSILTVALAFQPAAAQESPISGVFTLVPAPDIKKDTEDRCLSMFTIFDKKTINLYALDKFETTNRGVPEYKNISSYKCDWIDKERESRAEKNYDLIMKGRPDYKRQLGLFADTSLVGIGKCEAFTLKCDDNRCGPIRQFEAKVIERSAGGDFKIITNTAIGEKSQFDVLVDLLVGIETAKTYQHIEEAIGRSKASMEKFLPTPQKVPPEIHFISRCSINAVAVGRFIKEGNIGEMQKSEFVNRFVFNIDNWRRAVSTQNAVEERRVIELARKSIK